MFIIPALNSASKCAILSLYTLSAPICLQRYFQTLLHFGTCAAVCPDVSSQWSGHEQLYICRFRNPPALKSWINLADLSASRAPNKILSTHRRATPRKTASDAWRYEKSCSGGKFISCPEVGMRWCSLRHRSGLCGVVSFENTDTHSPALTVSSISRPQLRLNDESWKNTRDFFGYLLFP